MKLLDIAKRALADSEAGLEEALSAVENVAEGTSDEELAGLNEALDGAEAERVRAKAEVERLERIYKGREESRVPDVDEARTPIKVGREDGSNLTYHRNGEHSIVRDLFFSKADGDQAAMQRLQRHTEETRDVGASGSNSTAGAGFIPPMYLADEWVSVPRPQRNFVNKIPKMTMPPVGETITIPKLSTGVTVAPQANENDAVSETDITTTTVTAPLVTIAGQQDLSRQSLERSFPGLDMVIFEDLRKAYDQKVGTQVISGSGVSGQHLGIKGVTGVNAVTYNDGTPTGGELLGKIYDAIQQVHTNLFEAPNLIVMHPRRASWLARTQDSTFPIFQQGGLFHAFGEQDGGLVGMMAGLPVLADPTVPTNIGTTTNQDQVYVLNTSVLRWAEDPLRFNTFEEVLSGNLTVRLQLYAYSYFVPNRLPMAISVIDGNGLQTPTF